MTRTSVLLIALGSSFVALAPACSSGGGGGSTGATCPGGFDASANLGGTEAVSQNGLCGTLLQGTKQNGETCAQSSDCAPTCCACPGSSRSAQVADCDRGVCVVGPQVCCAWIANASFGSDGGVPYVCSK